jgi:hypothetical protein
MRDDRVEVKTLVNFQAQIFGFSFLIGTAIWQDARERIALFGPVLNINSPELMRVLW